MSIDATEGKAIDFKMRYIKIVTNHYIDAVVSENEHFLRDFEW